MLAVLVVAAFAAAPAAAQTPAQPVLLLIHGGGFFAGDPAYMDYAAAIAAEQGEFETLQPSYPLDDLPAAFAQMKDLALSLRRAGPPRLRLRRLGRGRYRRLARLARLRRRRRGEGAADRAARLELLLRPPIPHRPAGRPALLAPPASLRGRSGHVLLRPQAEPAAAADLPELRRPDHPLRDEHRLRRARSAGLAGAHLGRPHRSGSQGLGFPPRPRLARRPRCGVNHREIYVKPLWGTKRKSRSAQTPSRARSASASPCSPSSSHSAG